MDLEQIDPLNHAALAAWHATVVAADAQGREDTATPWQLPEIEAELADQTDVTRLVVAGIEDGRTVVAAGQMALRRHHSLDQADVGVYVHPEHQRRGHGTTMLAHLEEIARGHGRSVLNAETSWPVDGPNDGSGTPGVEFLRARGFRLGLVDVARNLDLPAPEGLLDRLAEEAAPHHAAYSLRSFVGPVPDDLVGGYAALAARLMVESPTGDLEREAGSSDVAAFRRGEAVFAAQGRTKHTTVALDPGGEVVGYTDIATCVHDPDHAFQWGTLVRNDHRGHRLGLALKVANLRLLQASQDRARRLRTWNAESNTHMVAVNEALGFRPVERLGELQKRLTTTIRL